MQDRDESCCVVPTSMLHWGFTSGVGMVLYKDSKVVCCGSPQFLGAKRLIFHSHQDKAVQDECQDPVGFISDIHHLPV